ncbi:hypothetical protein RYX36_031265 [Vicia faba]
MAFSYRMILFRVLLLVLIIFVTSQTRVDGRPLSINYYEWSSWGNGLLLQSLPNAPVPPSTGDPTHP